MCECTEKTCPKRQVWMNAVRVAAIDFFTTLSAALRERYRVYEYALCSTHCAVECDSEHDTVDMDALNLHLDPFYRSLDAARTALVSGHFSAKDLNVHLLRFAFEQVERRHWRRFRKAYRQAEQLMFVLRSHQFRVSEGRFTQILSAVRDCERRVMNALEPRSSSDGHLIAHASSAPIERLSKRRTT